LLEEFRSLVCVPMMANQEVVGTLLVCRPNYGSISPGEVQFLQDLGERAGQGLRELGEKEELLLNVAMKKAWEHYSSEVLQGYNSKDKERELLHEVRSIFTRYLDAEAIDPWEFDRRSQRLCRLPSGEGSLAECCDLTTKDFYKLMGDNSF